MSRAFSGSRLLVLCLGIGLALPGLSAYAVEPEEPGKEGLWLMAAGNPATSCSLESTLLDTAQGSRKTVPGVEPVIFNAGCSISLECYPGGPVISCTGNTTCVVFGVDCIRCDNHRQCCA